MTSLLPPYFPELRHSASMASVLVLACALVLSNASTAQAQAPQQESTQKRLARADDTPPPVPKRPSASLAPGADRFRESLIPSQPPGVLSDSLPKLAAAPPERVGSRLGMSSATAQAKEENEASRARTGQNARPERQRLTSRNSSGTRVQQAENISSPSKTPLTIDGDPQREMNPGGNTRPPAVRSSATRTSRPHNGAAPPSTSGTRQLYPRSQSAAPRRFSGSSSAPRSRSQDPDGLRTRAQSVSKGNARVISYGEENAYIRTTALRHTILELQRNEYVVNTFIGDDTRWQVETGVTGTQGNFTQVVAIKPLDCGITTNLSLTTNTGRIYQATLDAAPCGLPEDANPQNDYTSHVRWQYPQGMASAPAPPLESRPVRATRSYPTRRTVAREQESEELPSYVSAVQENRRPIPAIPVDEANTQYEIDVDRGVPCEPSMAVDDGDRMYVRFPDRPLCEETHPMYAETEEGELHLMNYEIRGNRDGSHTYVTDGVPVRAVIMYRTADDDERKVTIVNKQLEARLDRRR